MKPGIDVLGKILQRFDYVTDVYVPATDGKTDNCYFEVHSGAKVLRAAAAPADRRLPASRGLPFPRAPTVLRGPPRSTA